MYFYDNALRNAEEGQEISEASFRYPGPKPQTKENAIIMLSDIVEAASRALDEPTPLRLREMIDSLVSAKVEDGQLDECPLTFHDLTVVKQSLLETLTAAFHQRIRYPDQIHAEAQKVVREARHHSAHPRSEPLPVEAEPNENEPATTQPSELAS